MRKWLAVPIAILPLVLLTGLLIGSEVQAADKLSDGTYTMDYTVKKAEDDSVSIANDYFEKPAKVVVENDKIAVEIQMNHSKWITEFKVPSGQSYNDALVINNNKTADTRVVRFNVANLSDPLAVKMHVTVADIDYDHDYTVRFVFDMSKLKAVTTAESKEASKEESKEEPETAKEPSSSVGTIESAKPAGNKPGAASVVDTGKATGNPPSKASTDNPDKAIGNKSDTASVSEKAGVPSANSDAAQPEEDASAAVEGSMVNESASESPDPEKDSPTSSAVVADPQSSEDNDGSVEAESSSQASEVQELSAPMESGEQALTERSNAKMTVAISLLCVLAIAGIVIIVRKTKARQSKS